MSTVSRSRYSQRLNRAFRLSRAQWLKTQIVETEGRKTACEEIKDIIIAKYGWISEQEIGRIVRLAFPNIRRGKHSSGYKYFYQNLSQKTPENDCDAGDNSMSSSENILKEENEELRKQVKYLKATNIKHNHIQKELKNTKKELQKAQKQLQDQKHQNSCSNRNRLIKNVITSTPSPKTVRHDFTQIPCQLLLDIEIADHKKSRNIGSGAFGMCQLKLYRNIEVSVKYLKESSYQDLLHEAKVTKVLEGHPNLPILLGISPKTISEKYFVTKFHGKNLKGIPLWYVLKGKNCGIELKEFQLICYGVARGLLHMHIKGYLHNDLKQDNVVIDFIEEKPSPVIIDFGKSCTLSAGRTKNIPIAEREMYLKKHSHIAPELVDGYHEQTCSSDVYSFGILLSMITKYLGQHESAAVIGLVADKCIKPIPRTRPNMDNVVEELK